ncbi:hypothetical protein HMPREF0004_1805 [Achromobacter piechaudii ATCC 43553]|uniref:Uncharacterized protein n=1 Tax=Achromobacter piechaudii ATCC 43553 TaxID=742159 RepID=D4X8K8_9BURK|nr:hypothetical protein HMPREF0004_1805 [Achromobacter piechaudii ATCC 43553]
MRVSAVAGQRTKSAGPCKPDARKPLDYPPPKYWCFVVPSKCRQRSRIRGFS